MDDLFIQPPVVEDDISFVVGDASAESAPSSVPADKSAAPDLILPFNSDHNMSFGDHFGLCDASNLDDEKPTPLSRTAAYVDTTNSNLADLIGLDSGDHQMAAVFDKASENNSQFFASANQFDPLQSNVTYADDVRALDVNEEEVDTEAENAWLASLSLPTIEPVHSASGPAPNSAPGHVPNNNTNNGTVTATGDIVAESSSVVLDVFRMEPFEGSVAFDTRPSFDEVPMTASESQSTHPEDLFHIDPFIQTLPAEQAAIRDQINSLMYSHAAAGAKPVNPESVSVTSAKLLDQPDSGDGKVVESDIVGSKVDKPVNETDDFDFDIPSVKPASSTSSIQSSKPFVALEIMPATSSRVAPPAEPAMARPDLICGNGTELHSPTHPAPSSPRQLIAAASEWDDVQNIEPVFEDENEPRSQGGTKVVTLEPVTYGEVLAHLKESDELIDRYLSAIVTSVPRHGLAALFHRLCGGPQLHRHLIAERNLVFCIAACPFDNTDSVHLRVLHMLYRTLTGAKVDCPRYGSHWEQIGFQGHDPATDLRGAGFLSLLQLLYLVMDPKSQVLARNIYKLSLHERQNFPFALMGINLTRITVAAMREDCLNKECNRREAILDVMNDLYHGCFSHFYTTWHSKHKTIADSGFVIAEIESLAKKKPAHLLRLSNAAASPALLNNSSVSGPAAFTNFVELSEGEDPGRRIN